MTQRSRDGLARRVRRHLLDQGRAQRRAVAPQRRRAGARPASTHRLLVEHRRLAEEVERILGGAAVDDRLGGLAPAFRLVLDETGEEGAGAASLPDEARGPATAPPPPDLGEDGVAPVVREVRIAPHQVAA